MSAATYRPEVRSGAARILWGEAELIDHLADVIDGMTPGEAVDYLRDLAVMYRKASSDATRGRDEVTL